MARIETLQEFKLRTEWFSKDSIHLNGGKFITNGDLNKKVNPDGSLKQFEVNEDGSRQNYQGNTVVFLLDEDSLERIVDIRSRLYDHCGELLAQELVPAATHMTLHDLRSGLSSPELTEQMTRSEAAARTLLGEITENGAVRIKMKATYLFNMNNTSVVLGLAPVDEDHCYRLMQLYELFQKLEYIHLPYRLTPHITMAYYRPGVYDERQLAGLKKAMAEINGEVRRTKPFEIELSTDRLVYQTFTDMNHFVTE